MYNLKAMDLLSCFQKAPSPVPVAEHEIFCSLLEQAIVLGLCPKLGSRKVSASQLRNTLCLDNLFFFLPRKAKL